MLLSVLVFLLGAAAVSFAATKPKPKPKGTKLGAIGTAQLPGQWCKFGQAYTLGKAKGPDANAMNVTLKSAEYTIGQVKVGDRMFWPQEGEKLLVIHYSLHNPLPKEQHVDYGTITWTAVDSKSENKNQEYLGVGVEATSATLFDQAMKPAQKIQVYAIIRVSGNGEVPKLMAAGYEVPAPVARYDLHGKVKPLPAPYADPSDKTGATVANPIPGVIGVSYTTGVFDTKVEKVDFATPPFADEGYDANNDYVVVTFECKYWGQGSGGIGGSESPTSGMALKDADGVSYEIQYGPMPASSNRRFEPSVKQGDSIKFRLAFSVPKGVALKTLTLKEFHGYPVVIDLSAYKTP
jgi:hypothetical protein